MGVRCQRVSRRLFATMGGGKMNKGYLFFLSLILMGLVGEAWGVPPLPHTFYGTVKENGINVPDGTVIGAWIGGAIITVVRHADNTKDNGCESTLSQGYQWRRNRLARLGISLAKSLQRFLMPVQNG
jgi:hypothetical protein